VNFLAVLIDCNFLSQSTFQELYILFFQISIIMMLVGIFSGAFSYLRKFCSFMRSSACSETETPLSQIQRNITSCYLVCLLLVWLKACSKHLCQESWKVTLVLVSYSLNQHPEEESLMSLAELQITSYDAAGVLAVCQKLSVMKLQISLEDRMIRLDFFSGRCYT